MNHFRFFWLQTYKKKEKKMRFYRKKCIFVPKYMCSLTKSHGNDALKHS